MFGGRDLSPCNPLGAMYACPGCHERTIGYFRKWLSCPPLPARCSRCHAYSHADRTSPGLGLVVAATVITLCGFAAIAVHSPVPLLVGLAASVLYYLWHWHRVQLELVSAEAVAAARAAECAWGLVTFLAFFLN
jgi:hypothetical protein